MLHFSPFYFGGSLLKQNIRKKGALFIKATGEPLRAKRLPVSSGAASPLAVVVLSGPRITVQVSKQHASFEALKYWYEDAAEPQSYADGYLMAVVLVLSVVSASRMV